MSLESEEPDIIYVPEVDLSTCPFVYKCTLPRHNFICEDSYCRGACSEFLSMVADLKQRDIKTGVFS